MKKALSLLLALVMCLSLCACSSDAQPQDNGGLTKETMMSEAKMFNITEFRDTYAENALRAEEAYVGHTYMFTAFVDEVSTENCILKFYNDANKVSKNTEFINAPLSKDELRNLNAGERIQIVGSIEKIGPYGVILNQAYYIDNVSSYQASVLSLVYASVSDKAPAYSVVSLSNSIDGNIAQYCLVYFNGDNITQIKEGDEITIKGTLSRVNTNPLEGGCYKHYEKYVGLKMEDATLAD